MLIAATLSLVFAAAPPPSHMKAKEGFETSILATEPMIQDPVAFWITPEGTVYTAETERTNHGTMDNRSSSFWLSDDLQAQSVEDRLAYYEKWASKRAGGMAFYSEKPDRVRRSIDTDGDGVYDAFTIFGGPFNDPLDGIGAGVMQVGDEIWYTNIPHLWRLKDSDGDGVAELQESIHSGFGIRTALYGHDMHGLVRGMDGRVYFSIGDRGYNVTTSDGRVLKDPRAGAVFRCEPDGSSLELFHTGLRNPQELAFNAVGDLFAGDNNSDAGDRARIVFVAQDGETGWAMDYQTLVGANVRGPWSQEAIWEVQSDKNRTVRPAWTLPPLAHVGAGPSGFAYYPGLGLPEAYDDHFFMCDFTGTRGSSSVWSFKAIPSGAGYEIADTDKFLRNVLCTDVMFDWNGRVLVSEWGTGWAATEKGFLHAATHPESASDPRISEAKSLMLKGLKTRSDFALADLLSHPDMRVRQEAQFELADRGKADLFGDVLAYASDQPARLHALWGLGQIARGAVKNKKKLEAALAPVLGHLDDPDPEVRAQAAKVLGDPPFAPAEEKLIDALSDAAPRVVYHAIMSLGQLKSTEALPFLVGVLMENQGKDRLLRHAVASAFWKIGDRAHLVELAAHPMPAVRMGAVLALRRTNDPSLERLVFDSDLAVALEAARAVHDKPIPEAMPGLAALAAEFVEPGSFEDPRITPLLRRVISANLKIGGPAELRAIAALAQNSTLPKAMRLEALAALLDSVNPEPRDRVLGYWRPVGNAPRERTMIAEVLALSLPGLAAEEDSDLRKAALALAGEFDIALDPELLFATVADESKPESIRVASIEQLPADDPLRLRTALDASIASASPMVRTAARLRLLEVDPAAAEGAFLAALDSGSVSEQQAAIAALGARETKLSQQAIEGLWRKMKAGTLDSALGLDVLEAQGADAAWFSEGESSNNAWDVALSGGDVDRGGRIVRYNPSATCLRCHRVAGLGGDAGPALDGVGKRLDRAHLLASLIEPQATLAEGYEESSAMANMRGLLSPREIRDVVAYLATLTTETAPASGH